MAVQRKDVVVLQKDHGGVNGEKVNIEIHIFEIIPKMSVWVTWNKTIMVRENTRLEVSKEKPWIITSIITRIGKWEDEFYFLEFYQLNFEICRY